MRLKLMEWLTDVPFHCGFWTGFLPLERAGGCHRRLVTWGPFVMGEHRILLGFWLRFADQGTSDRVEYRTPGTRK